MSITDAVLAVTNKTINGGHPSEDIGVSSWPHGQPFGVCFRCTLSAAGRIVSDWVGDDDHFLVFDNILYVQDGGLTAHHVAFSSLADGLTHNVVAWYDAGAGTNHVYVDGIAVDSSPGSFQIRDYGNVTDVVIGAAGIDPGATGTIQDLRLFTHALTTTDVAAYQALFPAGPTTPIPSAPVIVASGTGATFTINPGGGSVAAGNKNLFILGGNATQSLSIAGVTIASDSASGMIAFTGLAFPDTTLTVNFLVGALIGSGSLNSALTGALTATNNSSAVDAITGTAILSGTTLTVAWNVPTLAGPFIDPSKWLVSINGTSQSFISGGTSSVGQVGDVVTITGHDASSTLIAVGGNVIAQGTGTYVSPSTTPTYHEMISTPAQIIQALLTQGSGSLFANPPATPWPLYIASMPDGEGVEESVGCIYDTEGRVLHRYLASGVAEVVYGVQIKVRAVDYTAGHALLAKIAQYLNTIQRKSVTLTPVLYGSPETVTIDTMLQTSPVAAAGQDQRRRAFFVVNYLLFLL